MWCLRVSSAFKRIEKANQPLMLIHLDTFLDRVIELPEVGAQPSAQWTIAQICLALTPHLTPEQHQRAKAHMMKNLDTMNDWIVLAQTMTTLTEWAKTDAALKIGCSPGSKYGQKTPPSRRQTGRKAV